MSFRMPRPVSPQTQRAETSTGFEETSEALMWHRNGDTKRLADFQAAFDSADIYRSGGSFVRFYRRNMRDFAKVDLTKDSEGTKRKRGVKRKGSYPGLRPSLP